MSFHERPVENMRPVPFSRRDRLTVVTRANIAAVLGGGAGGVLGVIVMHLLGG